jgi:uncharacterized OB-fold protein
MQKAGEYTSPEMISPEAEPFWAGAREGKLMMQTCRSCGRGHHFPRCLCPHCHSTDLEWGETDGRGTIYSYSVVTESKDSRYVIAYVEIAPGVKAVTNLVDCDPDSIAVGQSVEAVFRPSRSGQNILLFKPVGA